MSKSKKALAITFDLDMVSYLSGESINDELTLMFPKICAVLEDFPQIKSTWFIRIDSHISTLFGSPDFVFQNNKKEIRWLKDNGHQLGWHHHAYKFQNNKWVQETNEDKICNDLLYYGQIARGLGLNAARMGWGWHSNKSMSIINELGFSIDSSAIPKPIYTWDMTVKDWSRCSNSPYFPTKNDYQMSGEPSLQILEIPISTTHIPAPRDRGEVIRYINLAYRTNVLRKALDELNSNLVVSITHPYEIDPKLGCHPLLGFSAEIFRENLLLAKKLGFECITLEEVGSRFCMLN